MNEMPYEVLALKYRPRVFEDLVGQEAVTRTLTNAIQQGRVANAFLFAGVRGVGKTTTARILAKALNCASGPTVRPCDQCPACREIALGRALDVLEIDGASNNGVEQVREIIDGARYAPSRDRFKIYIIDEVHMLSQAAFNALLKTLEEPPPSVKFLFATTEHHKIPDTILSRCQEFEFRTVSPAEIGMQLQKIAAAEGISISEGAIQAIARAAEGSLRDAISSLDQVVAAVGREVGERDVTELLGLIERDVLRETALAVVARDTAAILRVVDDLVRSGRDLRYFASAWIQYLRDVLVARLAPNAPELLLIPGESEELKALARELSEEDLLRSLDVLTQAETDLRTAPEPRFHLEMALLKIAQLRRLATFEELLERFSNPSSRPVEAPPESQGEVEDSAPEQALMQRLVDELKGARPSLHAIVSRHHRARIDSDRLILSFRAEEKVLAEQLRGPELTALVEERASQIAGRKISLVVETPIKPDKPEKPDEQVGSIPSEKDELHGRASRDPLVRRFVETFRGEIEEVRPKEKEP